MANDKSRKPPFRYTDEQRREIIFAIQLKGAGVSSSLAGANAQTFVDKIERIVSNTRRAIKFREDHPVPDWLHDKFRGLDRPIEEILSVLEDPASKHLHEFFPNLCRDLAVLNLTVRGDQRKRGRPRNPDIELHIGLVTDLADIWKRQLGQWPKRSYSFKHKADSGSFHRFVRACLVPAKIGVSNETIRQVIEKSEPLK